MASIERVGDTIVGGPLKRVIVSEHATLDCLLPDLAEAGYTVVDERIPSGARGQDLIDLIKRTNAEALVCRTGVFLTKEVFEACEQLRLAVSASRNPDFDAHSATEHGVWTLRSRGNVEAVGERLANDLASFAGGTLASRAFASAGKWGKEIVEPLTFDHLFGTSEGVVLGIMGFGGVGRQVAKYALQRGFKVKIYNDGNGSYYKGLRQMAELLGIDERNFVKSPEALFEESDMVTVHVCDNNALGGSNSGAITSELIKSIGCRRPEQGIPRTLVNWARAEVVPPLNEIVGLIQNNRLGYYMVDVFGKEAERQAPFQTMIGNLPPEVARRILPTCHTAGSGKRVELAAQRDIMTRLFPAWEGGYFDQDQHFGFPRHDMEDMDRADGQVVFTVVTSTSRGIKARLLEAGLSLGMDSNNDHSVHDNPPGNPAKTYNFVPRTYVFNPNGGGSDYTELVQGIIGESDKINRGSEGHRIASVRFIPTNDEQKTALANMRRWTTNLGAV